MKNLYEECVKAGVKIESHYSDLYIPVNEITRKLVADHTSNGGAQPQIFKSNIAPHDLWYDIPFAYLPYWQEISRKTRVKK